MLKRASFETSHINFITSSDLMKKLLDIYSPDLYGQLLLSDEIYFPISESASKNYQSAAIRLLSTPANDPLFHYRKMDMLLNFIQNLTRHCANPATNAQPYPEHVVKIMQAIWKKENAHKTLSEILENMGYSYVQLSRIFKQYTHGDREQDEQFEERIRKGNGALFRLQAGHAPEQKNERKYARSALGYESRPGNARNAPRLYHKIVEHDIGYG